MLTKHLLRARHSPCPPPPHSPLIQVERCAGNCLLAGKLGFCNFFLLLFLRQSLSMQPRLPSNSHTSYLHPHLTPFPFYCKPLGCECPHPTPEMSARSLPLAPGGSYPLHGQEKRGSGDVNICRELQMLHLGADPGSFGFRTRWQSPVCLPTWSIHTCVVLLQTEKPAGAMAAPWSDEKSG